MMDALQPSLEFKLWDKTVHKRLLLVPHAAKITLQDVVSASQQSQIASNTLTVQVKHTLVGKCYYEQEIKAQDVSMHIKTMALPAAHIISALHSVCPQPQ